VGRVLRFKKPSPDDSGPGKHKGCEQRFNSWDKYCPACGQQNHEFNEEDLIKAHKQTLQQAMAAECQKGHPFMKIETPDLLRDFPFCDYCGGKVGH